MFFRKHAFTVKIICLLLFASIIPLLLVNRVWYRVSTNNLVDKIAEQSESMMKQLNMNLGNYINNIEISAISVAFDDDVKEILFSQQELSVDKYKENAEFLEKELNKVVYNNATISRITMLTDIYQVNSSGEPVDRTEFEGKPWYKQFVSSGKLTGLTGVYYRDYGRGKEEPTLAYIQRIPRVTGETARIIVVEIRYAKIRRFFSDIVNGGENKLFVFDNENIIYSPEGFLDSSEITDELRDLIRQAKKCEESCDYEYQGSEHLLFKKNIIFTSWTVVELVDKDMLFSSANSIVSWLNKMILVLVVLLITISACFIYHMIKPLSQIEEYMKKVEQNQFDIRFRDISEDELGRIKAGFNKMIGHIEYLLQDIERKETEKREITIKALKAQINPHFLYNTLNIIRWRAVMAGNETIGNMIVTLIQTMEFNGKRKEEFVTVRDEIDNVKNYVQLLKYHYEDKFDVVYDVDDTVSECYICKLVLQPLVENSVFHGIIPKKKMGEIIIRVKREGEIISFMVRDNGVGMNEQQEKNIEQGIGYSNVNDRIRYYFGEEHSIKVKNIYGEGVTIYFSIPIITSLPYYREVMREEG